MLEHAQETAFDPARIAAVPQSPGAYRLLRGGRVIYVGIACGARSLRSELTRHWRGDFGPRTQGASHFEYLAARTTAHAHELYRELYLSAGLRIR